jgi:hypothetical protein
LAATIAASDEFAQINNCGTTLPVGDSCSVAVTFQPVTGGLKQATLSIQFNDIDTPNLSIALAGTATNLYGSFTGAGIWQWDGSTWNQVTPNKPDAMVVSGSNLYATFPGNGIYKWDGSSWTQLTPGNPVGMAIGN